MQVTTVDFGLDQLRAEMQKCCQELSETICNTVSANLSTFIGSLGVPGLEVRKPIPITIRPDGSAFIATSFDANISASGESPEEAVDSLQSLIADFFEDLDATDPSRLGPGPRKQIAVLREHLCRTSKPSTPG